MGYQGKLRFMRTAGGLTHHNAVRKKITSVKVTRLVFLDDHGMLTDITPESKDWRKGGTRYIDKQGGAHWLAAGASYPASITKATQLTIEIEIEIDSADADPIECVIRGRPSHVSRDSGGTEPLTFEASAEFAGRAKHTLRLRAAASLKDQVHLIDAWTLTWTCEAAAATFEMGRTGPHQLYVTYDTPNPGGQPLVKPAGFGEDPAPLEDGITHKRMHAAVRITEAQWRQAVTMKDPETGKPMDRNDPHVLAQILNATVPGYTLARNPSVPEGYDHPQYLTQKGTFEAGAWPIVDYRDQKAECQAIVRYVRGMLMQIGCPGQAEFVVVYAHERTEGGAKALVDSIIPPDSDATKYRLNIRTGKMELSRGLHRDGLRLGFVEEEARWQIHQLADGNVSENGRDAKNEEVVGRSYAPATVFNNYEACFRFTYAEKMRYHAGGVAHERFHDAQDVLEESFWGLVWVSQSKASKEKYEGRWVRLDEVVRRYRAE